MKWLHKEEFVQSFFASNELEGNMGSVVERGRLMAEIDTLCAHGKSKYEAIMELCQKNKITFKIEEEDDGVLRVATFINHSEWSHCSINVDANSRLSKIVGREIFGILCMKYKNSIFVENVLKK